MELLAAAAMRRQMPAECLGAILGSLTTEEALGKLPDDKSRETVMQDVMEHIAFYLDRRAAGKMQIECIVYSNEFGELGCTQGAKLLLEQIKHKEEKLR